MLDKILALDQQITLALNGSDSLFWDGIAMTATQTLTWIPLALVLLYVIVRNNDARTIGLILLSVALCVLIADQVASGICKPLFQRYRPAQDPAIMYLVDVVDGYRGGKYGFFSSHAANTFSLAVFVSLLIRHKALSCGLISWALLNCWTRVYLGVHYFGDLLVGTLFGTFVGCFIYFLFKKVSKLEVDASHRPEIQTSTGYSPDDAYLLLSALFICYIYVVIRAVACC